MYFLWVLLVLFALAALTLAATAAVYYVKFQQRPEKQWKDQVHAELKRVRTLRAAFRLKLDNLDGAWQQESSALEEQFFARVLSGIGINELETFPGIGPATVARLREGGYHSLQGLQNAYISIAGIGQKRLADITQAVGTLTRQAHARFKSGACPEANELARVIPQRRHEIDTEKSHLRLKLEVAEKVGLQLRRLADEANAITLWKFITSGEDELVSQALLAKPIPTFEGFVDASARKPATEPQTAQRTSTPPPEQTWAAVEKQISLLDRQHAAASQAQPAPNLARAKPSEPPLAILWPVPVATKVQTPVQPIYGAVQVPSAPGRQGTPPSRPIAAAAAVAALAPVAPADKAHLILDLTVQFAFVVARCDSHLAHKERDWIENHFKNRYRHDGALFNRVRALCAHYETAALNVEDCIVRINQEFTAGHKAALVKMAYEIAAAAGEVNQREAKFLHKICQRFNVAAPVDLEEASPTSQVVQSVATAKTSSKPLAPPLASQPNSPSQPFTPMKLDPRPASPTPAGSRAPAPPSGFAPANIKQPEVGGVPRRDQLLAILEIELSTPLSADLIRRQYTHLMEKLAPEKVQALGSDIAAVVQQKRQKVEHAARTLIAQWNEELIPKNTQAIPKDLRHNPDLDALFGA
jgi:tellurite resistance protein